MILLRSFLSGHIRIKRTREYYDAGIGPNVPFGAIGVSPVVSQNFLTNTTVPSWMDVSATTGNRMLYDSTGKLTYAPNNLAPNSQNFTTGWVILGLLAFGSGSTQDTNATTDPFGLNNAALITEDTAAGRHFVYRNIATAVGTKYVASIYVKAGTRTIVALGARNGTGTTGYVAVFNLSNGTVSTTNNVGTPTGTSNSITPIGNGWYRISVSMIVDTTSVYFECGLSNSATPAYFANMPTYTGDGSSGLYIYGAQLEAVTYQTTPSTYNPTTTAAYYGPRFDYDPSTLAAKGLLIEESRANICTYSEDFGTSYTTTGLFAFGSGSTLNATTSPDGLVTADLIGEDATNNYHRIYKSITTTANTAYSYSLYVKRASGTRNLFVTLTTGADTIYVHINLGTGQVTNSGATGTGSLTSATAEPTANGFYRVKLCGIVSTSSGGVFTQIFLSNTATATTIPSYIGDGTSSIYIWGAQLEAGSFATSYIPTTTASVTRAADVIKLSGAALTAVQGSAVSALVQTTPWPIASTSYGMLGAGTSARLIYASNSGNTIIQTFNGSSATSATIGGGATLTGNVVRAGVSWLTAGGANSVSLVANNGTVGNSAATFTVGASVYLGAYNVGGGFNGCIQSLAIYNQRLPDATLKTKSVVGSSL